jgi:hypothetical protein
MASVYSPWVYLPLSCGHGEWGEEEGGSAIRNDVTAQLMFGKIGKGRIW